MSGLNLRFNDLCFQQSKVAMNERHPPCNTSPNITPKRNGKVIQVSMPGLNSW